MCLSQRVQAEREGQREKRSRFTRKRERGRDQHFRFESIRALFRFLTIQNSYSRRSFLLKKSQTEREGGRKRGRKMEMCGLECSSRINEKNRETERLFRGTSFTITRTYSIPLSLPPSLSVFAFSVKTLDD